ncbi:MAG: hypothetical protein ACLP9C_09970 [Acidimicrobiales bacterium]
MAPCDGEAVSGPPADPEDWTDEQWLAWLDATDTEDTAPAPRAARTPGARVVESPAGRVLGDAMLGLAYAVFGRQVDEVAIVAEGDSEPGDDEAFSVRLDPEHPERSVVIFPRTDPPAT